MDGHRSRHASSAAVRRASTVSRRTVFRGAAGLAGAATLGGGIGSARPARAQGLTGKITVGFEGSNAALATLMDSVAAAVKVANPAVEIELQPAPGGNYQTQLFLALSAGRAPDVFVITGLGIGELGAAGFLAPLDGYLAGWDGWPEYPETVRKAITYQDTIFGLPYVLDTHFLYYRQDLFERAGLPRVWQPSTPDDILAAARQLKSALPEVMAYGLYAGANGGNSTAVRGFLPLVYAYGGSLTDETGKWIIDSCAIRSALAYYQTAYQVDQTVPEQAMTAANPSSMLRQAFATGELAMIYDGSWVYGDWEAAVPEIAREQTGFVLFPTADGRPPFAVGGLGNTWYINAKAGQKDLAWTFVAAANAPEALVAVNSVSPHIPPRMDAATDPAFQASPFLSAMVGTLDDLVIAAPDPSYRQLIGVIQNATGVVAAGEGGPEEAATRYADEMTRILGKDRVVKRPCG
jgi:multiple sugar transport system substrate-binding protein